MLFLEIKQLIGKFTIYQYMICFLMILALASAFFYGFGVDSLIPVVIAAGTATLLDFGISYFKHKNPEFPQSAMISGLFIGGLLAQNLQWYVYAAAGAIAVLSKHLIKINQKHIFNPAIIGILFASFIFGAAHTWWISSPLILVLVFGIFIAWRLRKIDLALGFVVSYFLVSSVIEFAGGAQISEVYYMIANGGVIYFFAMYMLTEPRTSPTARKQKIAYGILVAVLLILFSQYPRFYHNSLSGFFTKHDMVMALSIGNLFVPILNKMKFEFVKKKQNPETTL